VVMQPGGDATNRIASAASEFRLRSAEQQP
jgi:hypothetical protein